MKEETPMRARYPGKKQRFYLGRPYWLYRDSTGQWFYTLNPEDPTAAIGPFPDEGEAMGKALLRIGGMEAEERRRQGLL